MLNPMAMKVLKIVVNVASVTVPVAAKYFADRDLDEKIAKKAAEAVAEAMKKES